MPGFATHYIFGENTISQITNVRERNCIRNHIHSFCLGLQGPDVFYYSLPAYASSTGNIGSQIHASSTLAFFVALMEARSHLRDRESRQIADAYISGFIGHYTLDTYCHPYVYCRTKHMEHKDQSLYDFSRHVFLETAMDQSMIRHFHNTRPSDFRPEKTIALSPKERHVISRLLYRAIAAAYPGANVPQWQISFAIGALQTESRMMHDPNGWKKLLVRTLEQKILGQAFISPMIPSDTVSIYPDSCNLSHRRWHNPWDPTHTSNDSVYDLMDQALPVFRRRIHLYFQSVTQSANISGQAALHARNSLLSDLGDCSYNSGLPLK